MKKIIPWIPSCTLSNKKTTLKEIPINELDILINKMGIIIENSKQEKTYTFDEYLVYDFIEDVKDRIIDEIYKYQKD